MGNLQTVRNDYEARGILMLDDDALIRQMFETKKKETDAKQKRNATEPDSTEDERDEEISEPSAEELKALGALDDNDDTESLVVKEEEILDVIDGEPIVQDDERREDSSVSISLVRAYFREISKIPLLSIEEERTLAKKNEKGDEESRKTLIESNLRLVVKIAKGYCNRGLPLLDLIEEGNLGLMKAIERFKTNKECKVSTYATWWIRQGIERALICATRTIRIPVHMNEFISRRKRIIRTLIGQLGRVPNLKELLVCMYREDLAQAEQIAGAVLDDTDAQKIFKVVKKRLMWAEGVVLRLDTFSLDCEINSESEETFSDCIADTRDTPEMALQRKEVAQVTIPKALSVLSEKELRVITLRFGLDNGGKRRTLQETAELVFLCREQVRKIEQAAMKKMKRQVIAESSGAIRKRAMYKGP